MNIVDTSNWPVSGNDYPSKTCLRQLRKKANYPVDIDAVLKQIYFIWWMPKWGFTLKGKRVKRLYLSTGGWSGNETIIEKLKTTYFWYFFWQSSRRGGHYYFRLPE